MLRSPKPKQNSTSSSNSNSSGSANPTQHQRHDSESSNDFFPGSDGDFRGSNSSINSFGRDSSNGYFNVHLFLLYAMVVIVFFFLFFISNGGGRKHRDSNNSFSSINLDNANGSCESLVSEQLDNIVGSLTESMPIQIPNANR